MTGKMLWTQDGPLAWCELDETRFEIQPVATGAAVFFQLIVTRDGELVDNVGVGWSAQEMAVYAEGLVDGDELDHERARHAVREWKWAGSMWGSPGYKTEPIEFDDEP